MSRELPRAPRRSLRQAPSCLGLEISEGTWIAPSCCCATRLGPRPEQAHPERYELRLHLACDSGGAPSRPFSHLPPGPGPALDPRLSFAAQLEPPGALLLCARARARPPCTCRTGRPQRARAGHWRAQPGADPPQAGRDRRAAGGLRPRPGVRPDHPETIRPCRGSAFGGNISMRHGQLRRQSAAEPQAGIRKPAACGSQAEPPSSWRA